MGQTKNFLSSILCKKQKAETFENSFLTFECIKTETCPDLTCPDLTYPDFTLPDLPVIIWASHGYPPDTLKTPSRHPLETLQTVTRLQTPARQTSRYFPDTLQTPTCLVTKFQTCRVVPSARSKVWVVVLLLPFSLPSFFRGKTKTTPSPTN